MLLPPIVARNRIEPAFASSIVVAWRMSRTMRARPARSSCSASAHSESRVWTFRPEMRSTIVAPSTVTAAAPAMSTSIIVNP
jgi:hypothetical protein